MVLSLFRRYRRENYTGNAKQIAFLVGTGRCGTTILAQVLNAHSKICVPPELQLIVSIGNGDRFYEKYISSELQRYGAKEFIRLVESCCPYYLERFFDYREHFRSLKYPQKDLGKVLRGLFDHICFVHKKEVFVEQTPWHGQKLDVLKTIFPEMKVIHMVRDGRDVAVSFARSPWWSDSVEDNLVQWEKEVGVIHQFGKNNPDNFIQIRYEDLALNPERQLGKILDLFGLKFERQMLEPENLVDYMPMFKSDISGNVSKEFKKWSDEKKEVFFMESIYAWKRNKGVDFSVLASKVVDTLKLYGYET